MASINQILSPVVLTEVISRMADVSTPLLSRYGMNRGGKNEVSMGHGRAGSYFVYNNLRTAAAGRAPGTAAGRSARNAVGSVSFTYPRMHDSLFLLGEELHNLANIQDPTQRDVAGKSYIQMQTGSLAQKAGNWRLAQLIGLLRGSLYMAQDGDTWYPTWSAPGGSVFSFAQNLAQMPAGNQNQLNMQGTGNIIDQSWANPGTNIPGHIQNISAAMQALNGGMLSDIECSSAVWQYVINNDFVAQQAGIANAPYQIFDASNASGTDGRPVYEYTARVAAIPNVTFHISDAGLELGAPGSEVFTPFWGTTQAVFTQSPMLPNLFKMYNGSEPIAEYDGAPETVKTGFAAWSTKSSNPTGTNVFVLDNALALNMVPTATAYGTVVF